MAMLAAAAVACGHDSLSPTTCGPGEDCPACTFSAGQRVAETLDLTLEARARIPIKHIVVITEENRSFDHLFGRLPAFGQPGVDGWPDDFTNPDTNLRPVAPFHLVAPTLEASPPHQGAAMHAAWNDGRMDGFVRTAAVLGSDGHYVMGYYDGVDLPFFYWLANTFAIADRYFGSALGGTWANRDFLYTGTSDGVLDTGSRVITVPSIFAALDSAQVGWAVFTDSEPRQDCIGWQPGHPGVFPYATFRQQLADGSLPTVSFLDPTECQDTEPPRDLHGPETWLREIYETALASPLWGSLAIVLTQDESGGLADHVPPPPACPPSPEQAQRFSRYGIRLPAIVISPWARPHFVSHAVHDHSSVLRLIEVLADLPALTARDANADALLDMFDFQRAALMRPPEAPAAGIPTCSF
jgi:phospholipase C